MMNLKYFKNDDIMCSGQPGEAVGVKAAGLQEESSNKGGTGGPRGEPPARRPHGRDAEERQFHVARAA